MSSTEQLINIPAENQCNEHSNSDDDLVQSRPSTPPRARRLTWSYLKCIIWAAVTGIFNCGHIVFDQPVADQWPAIIVGEQKTEFATVADRVFITSEQSLSEQATEDTNVTELQSASIEQTLVADVHEASEAEPIPNHIVPCVTDDKFAHILSDSLINCFDEKPRADLDISVNFDSEHPTANGLCRDSHSTYSPAFTLLSAYYAEANTGLIDELTRDTLIEELLQSVIPRNLSDSSEVSISPKTRKMYAWADPSPENSDQPGASKKQNQFDLDSNSSVSDERLPYPGKLTMSDHSFSPLSPSTVESNTLMQNYGESPNGNQYHDLNLPDMDRHEHTLEWAMANLRTDEKELEKRNLAGRPPLPNSLTRQGRDKSPVSTATSVRLTDAQSVPSYMDFEGYHIFEDQTNDVPKPKRSSSLKSQRTPPGTPGQKVVRFADALGLDLETVRHVFDQEAPPKIPASATFDLELDTDESIAKLGAKQFRLCFAQPGSAANFIRRVLEQTVCLEDAHVEMSRGMLIGTIRVKSLGFEKHVFVRVTYNDWSTYCDTTASYVQGSHDGATDRFSFSLVFPDTMVPGRRVQFAIRYDAHTGEQFWDNNHGQNYSVICYAKATDLAGDGSWLHYL